MRSKNRARFTFETCERRVMFSTYTPIASPHGVINDRNRVTTIDRVTANDDSPIESPTTPLALVQTALMQIPVADHITEVFDPIRNRLYIATERGVIERFDLASQTLLTPLAAGTSILGMDISVDGRWLGVTESLTSPASASVRLLDLDLAEQTAADPAAPYLQRLTFTGPGFIAPNATDDIIATATGQFLIACQSPTTGTVYMLTLDPVTKALQIAPAALPSTHSYAQIVRSADARYVLIDPGSPQWDYSLSLYDTVGGQVIATGPSLPFNAGSVYSVNRDGTLFMARSRVFNRSMQVVTDLFVANGGFAFDPTQDIAVASNTQTDMLHVLRTSDFSTLYTIPAGYDVTSASTIGNGTMTFTPDGSQLFLAVPGGIRIIQMRADPGAYTITEGSPLALIGNGQPPAGRSYVSWEWDLDYNEGQFDVDLSGKNVTIPSSNPLLDGPLNRVIALRATDDLGQVFIGVGTLVVQNAPPQLTVTAPTSVAHYQSVTVRFSATDVGNDTITQWRVKWPGGFEEVLSGTADRATREMSVEGSNLQIVVTAVDEDGSYSRSNTIRVATPPTVVDSSYQYDASVPAAQAVFSETVQRVGTGVTLTNLISGAVVPSSQYVVSLDPTGRILQVRRSSGVFADGRYRLTLQATQIADVAGNRLDGNGDGVAGDNYSFDYFVFAGDLNRDGNVDFADLLILAQHYGQAGQLFSQGNVDYSVNGIVDFSDLLALAQRLGTVLSTTVEEPRKRNHRTNPDRAVLSGVDLG